MLKVFVDTNVVLDFVLNRSGMQNALDIFQLGEDAKAKLTVSFLTMANVAYVARKHRTTEVLYAYLQELAMLFEILPMDESQFGNALDIKASDFEDVLQYVCAKQNGSNVIITNNVKHFSFSDIPVLSPQDFLEKYF